jgi:hypothetical protein
MNRRHIPIVLAAWCTFVLAAILNGGFREGVLVAAVGDAAANIVSTLMLAAIILVLAFVLLRKRIREFTRRELYVTGALWLVLTVGFEFVFGRFVAGDEWSALLDAYNIFAGRLWVLIPVTVFVAPHIVHRSAGAGSLRPSRSDVNLQQKPASGRNRTWT